MNHRRGRFTCKPTCLIAPACAPVLTAVPSQPMAITEVKEMLSKKAYCFKNSFR